MNILTSNFPNFWHRYIWRGHVLLGAIGSASSDATVRLACYIVNTADYCAENIPKLEENIKSRIDSSFIDQVDMEKQQDDMYDAINVSDPISCLGLCTRNEQT